jgi:hypothetical protein
MVLLSRHSAEIIRGPTGPTRERDNPAHRRKRLWPRGLEADDHSFWIIAATSLPLFANGSASQCSIDHSRREKGFYRQTVQASDRTGSSASATGADFHQRLGRESFASGVGAIQNAWLRANASRECVAKSTTCLIVMCPKKYRKSINGWCRSQKMDQLNRTTN